MKYPVLFLCLIISGLCLSPVDAAHAKSSGAPAAGHRACILDPVKNELAHRSYPMGFGLSSLAEKAAPVKLGRKYCLELIVRPAAAQVPHATIIGNHGSFDGFTLEQKGAETGVFLFGFGNGQDWETHGPIKLEADRWNYVVVNVAGDTLTVYVNGRAEVAASLKSQMKNTEAPVLIGNWSHGDRPFQGEIKEMRLSSGNLGGGYVKKTWAKLEKVLK